MRHPYAPDHASWLVLRAALADGEVAARSWREWAATHSIDDAPPEIVRLLPLVSRNLPPGAATPAEEARLAGIFRQSWYRNQTRVRGLTPALAELADAHIPTMLLKGGAILATVPGAAGLRPMHDIDLLVGPEHVGAAADILQRHGFSGWVPPQSAWVLRHAAELSSETAAVDLHWQPMAHVIDAAPLWADARRATLQGVDVIVPSTVDLMLIACVHGMGPLPTPLQWFTDLSLLLGSAPDFDWQRLLDRAREWSCVPQVRSALTTFAAEPSLTHLVPAGVVERLATLPASRRDRFVHHAVTGWRTEVLARRLWYWSLYRSWAKSSGERPTLGRFVDLTVDLTGRGNRKDLAAYFLWRRRRVMREKVAAR